MTQSFVGSLQPFSTNVNWNIFLVFNGYNEYWRKKFKFCSQHRVCSSMPISSMDTCSCRGDEIPIPYIFLRGLRKHIWNICWSYVLFSCNRLQGVLLGWPKYYPFYISYETVIWKHCNESRGNKNCSFGHLIIQDVKCIISIYNEHYLNNY